MSHRQTRIEQAAEGKHREFCRAQRLTLSKHGHSVVWEKEWYCVFRFGEQKHADRFMKEFGGEPMHPEEKGREKCWTRRKKGTCKPKPTDPYDISDRLLPEQFPIIAISLLGHVSKPGLHSLALCPPSPRAGLCLGQERGHTNGQANRRPDPTTCSRTLGTESPARRKGR